MNIACFQAATLDVEDLEADATPEDLMLSYVSGEKSKVLYEALVSFFTSIWLKRLLSLSYCGHAVALLLTKDGLHRIALTVSMSHPGSSSCGRLIELSWTS